MTGKNFAVFGIYPYRAGFEYASGTLKKEGFRETVVLLQENPGTKDLTTNESHG